MDLKPRGRPRKEDPHTHMTSREQWTLQVKAITENLDSMSKELRIYEQRFNSTMKTIIHQNITTRQQQLKKKLSEVPPKDRPVDIANNKWCLQCLQ